MSYVSPEMQRSFQHGYISNKLRQVFVTLSNRCIESEWITLPSNELEYYQ